MDPATAALFPARFGENGLPEGWRPAPLIDLAHWVNGAAYKNMHFSDAADALPVVKIAELKNGITDGTRRTATDLGRRYRISDGDLLFSWSGNPDTSIDAFIWVNGDAWLNQHIFSVRTNGRRSKPFLYFLLRFLRSDFAEIARNKQTTGLGHVTKEDMGRLLTCEAPKQVLEAYDQSSQSMFDRLVASLRETKFLAALRDALLPKLMSGELRVRDAEHAVVEIA